MIHIIFNEPDRQALEAAMELDESLRGSLLVIKDDYAVGPLALNDDAEGWKARRDWWRMLLAQTGTDQVEESLDMVDDRMTVHRLMQQLEAAPDEVVWIWAAQNQHDVCGYYWLISQLQHLHGRIYILYLNNLPFLNEKGSVFYPRWLSQIPPKEFLKARKLARQVTQSEFELDKDEWMRLAETDSMVRILEGGKKISASGEQYFDGALSRYVTGDFNRAQKIIGQFQAKEQTITGDVFLLWRLKTLIGLHQWEVRGDMEKSGKDFELRNPSMPSFKKKPAADSAEENVS